MIFILRFFFWSILFFVFSLVTVPLTAFAGTESKYCQAVSGYYFIGTIGKLPVQLTIEFTPKHDQTIEVDGQYFYDRVGFGDALSVRGIYDEKKSTFDLTEFISDKDGKWTIKTGSFNGKYKGNSLDGQWQSPDKKKILPFHLKRVAKTVQTIHVGQYEEDDEDVGYITYKDLVFDDRNLHRKYCSEFYNEGSRCDERTPLCNESAYCRKNHQITEIRHDCLEPSDKRIAYDNMFDCINYYSSDFINIEQKSGFFYNNYSALTPQSIFLWRNQLVQNGYDILDVKDLIDMSPKCLEKLYSAAKTELVDGAGEPIKIEDDDTDDMIEQLIAGGAMSVSPANLVFEYVDGNWIRTYRGTRIPYARIKECIPEKSPLRRFVDVNRRQNTE